jgi:uncharacterized membrane protein YeaQ/YmgE (transglycosylase-associated protein family)
MAVGLFIIGMILWGMVIGWIGQLLLGGGGLQNNDWLQAIIAGALGSLLAGTVISLVLGEGLTFRPGGIIASVIGAVVVLLIWRAVVKRKQG